MGIYVALSPKSKKAIAFRRMSAANPRPALIWAASVNVLPEALLWGLPTMVIRKIFHGLALDPSIPGIRLWSQLSRQSTTAQAQTAWIGRRNYGIRNASIVPGDETNRLPLYPPKFGPILSGDARLLPATTLAKTNWNVCHGVTLQVG